jgi:hypothetical protein
MAKIFTVVAFLACLLTFVALFSFTPIGDEIVRSANRNQSNAEVSADFFVGRLGAGQFQQAYNSTSPEFQSRQSLEQLAQLAKSRRELWRDLVRRKSGIVLIGGGRIEKAFVEFARPNDATGSDCTVVLRKVGSDWLADELFIH